jgi:hypothetical protein
MVRITRSLLSSFLLLLSFSVAWAQFPVTDDTFIASGSSTVQGTNTSAQVAASPVTVTLVKYDLSGLPVGTTAGQVTKATAKFFIDTVSLTGSFDVCQVTSNWSEGSVVYSSRPSLSSTPIQTGIPVTTVNKYPVADITSAVHSWVTSPASNFGIALVPSGMGCSYTGTPSTSINVKLDTKENLSTSHDTGLNVFVTLNNGTVTSVGTGEGLTGGPITTSGTISMVPPSGNVALGGVKGLACPQGNHYSSFDINGTLTCTPDSASSVSFSAITAGTNMGQGLIVGSGSTLSAMNGGTIVATSAQNAVNAMNATNATNFTGSLSGDVTGTQSGTVVSAIGGVSPSSFARLDLANLFGLGAKQTFRASSAYAGLNITGVAQDPSSLAPGDLWFNTTDQHLHFRDSNNPQSLALMSDLTSANSNLLAANNHWTGGNTFDSASGTFNGSFTGSLSGNGTNVTNVNAALFSGQPIGAFVLQNGNAMLGTVAASSFSGGNITGNGAGVTNLDAGNVATGTLGDARLSNNVALITRANVFGADNKQTFTAGANYAGLNIAGVGTDPNVSNLAAGDLWFNTNSNHLLFRDQSGNTKTLAFQGDTINGTFTGDGSGLTSLDANNISSGTLADARLSGNVALRNASNSFTGANTFSNANGTFSGTFSGNGAGLSGVDAATLGGNAAGAFVLQGGNAALGNITGNGAGVTNLDAGNVATGTLGDARLSNNVALRNQSNTFSATQTLAPLSNAALQPSNLLQLNAKDASNNSQSAQLQARADGGLSFQFGPTGSATEKLSIDNTGKINFAVGQTFPGTQSSLTAGTGISIASNTVTNTGVTSLAGTANQINVSAANGAVTLSLPNTVAVSISGSAASAAIATTANSAGSATNFTGNLAGDVTGGQSTTTVAKINGTPLGTLSGATNGQTLTWNGSSWVPATPSASPTILSGFCTGAATFSTLGFAGLGGPATGQTSQACADTMTVGTAIGVPMTSGGTLKNLRVYPGTLANSSTSVTFTVYVAAAPGWSVNSTSNPNTASPSGANNLTGSGSIAPGTLTVTIATTTNHFTNADTINIQLNSQTLQCNGSGGNTFNATVLNGNRTLTAASANSISFAVTPSPCTAGNGNVAGATSSGTLSDVTNPTFTTTTASRTTPTATTLACTIGAPTTSAAAVCSDTSDTVAVNAGDLVSVVGSGGKNGETLGDIRVSVEKQ